MFKKSNMNKKHSFNFGGALCLAATVYVIYYLLIKDNFLPSSVSSMLSVSERHCHILGVALVPIFLGLMIFGAGVFSIYIGSAVQRWLSKLIH